jgi:hypothetical protein
MYLKGIANLNAVTEIYSNLHNRYKLRFHNIINHIPDYKHERTSLEPLKGDGKTLSVLLHLLLPGAGLIPLSPNPTLGFTLRSIKLKLLIHKSRKVRIRNQRLVVCTKFLQKISKVSHKTFTVRKLKNFINNGRHKRKVLMSI